MLQLDDRRFNRLALTGLGLGLFLLVAAFAASVFSIESSRRSTQMVRHTYQVVDQLSALELQLERIENGRRGFILAPHPYRLQLFQRNSALALRSLDRVERMVRDNDSQTARLAQLRTLLNQIVGDSRTSMQLVLAGRREEARAQFAAQDVVTPIRRSRAITAALQAEENRLLGDRTARETGVLQLVNTVLWVAGLLLLALAAATFWLVRRYTKDLAGARDRLHRLNTNLEGEVRLRTADLTRANEEIQRFAYIVSHDLRSPLVNVLGFTAELESANKAIGGLVERAEVEAPQLITDEVRYARDDLPEAIGFIRTSTQKMDRLINAILKLSRQGRRTLSPEPLAMKPLLEDIASSLEKRLKDGDSSLVVDADVPDLHSDRLAIEQIFSNIMENAVKYLQPGRPGLIQVRGKADGERVIYEVEDNGRGIDPADHARVFDLFRRAGKQDQPGEGIGLAHVRALIYRLGGTIDLQSALGEGTTFRLNLPRRFSDRGGAD